MNRALEIAAEIAKPFEGLRLAPYHDPVGFPTIGYGHLLSRDKWADLSRWQPISESEALSLLENDMASAAASVGRLINVPLSDNQRAALIDFAFNCGGGNLQLSTLRRKINRREFIAAADEFKKWVYAQKRKLPGLVRRRAAEKEIWLS